MRDLGVLADSGRLKGYSRLAIAIYIAGFALLLWLSPNLVDPSGKPIGYDFITFWSAGHLTLGGDPAAAFDMKSIFAAQRLAVPASDKVFLWHYPPTFQIVAAGLALLPYLASYALFVVVSLVAYVMALRPLVRWREPELLLLAFPGAFLCVLHGQNALISAALTAGAIVHLERRPVISGICIGLLAYKPQFGLLWPLVLVVTGQWRTIGVAACVTIAFSGLATLMLGFDLWQVFLANTAVVREVLETGQLPWAKIPSAFIFLRLIGVPQWAAYAAHILVAAAAIIVTVHVWWRCGPTRLAGATLVCGTLLLSPYVFDYELAMLAIPLAVLAGDMIDREPSGQELALLMAAFVAPPLLAGIGEASHLQLGFPLLLLMLTLSARRALGEQRAIAAASPEARRRQAIEAIAPRAEPDDRFEWRPASGLRWWREWLVRGFGPASGGGAP